MSLTEISKVYDGNNLFAIGSSYSTEVTENGLTTKIITTEIQGGNILVWQAGNIIAGDSAEINFSILSIIANKPNTNATVASVDFGQFVSTNYYIFNEEIGEEPMVFTVDCAIVPKDIVIAFAQMSHVYDGQSRVYEYGTNETNRYFDTP